jgi:ribosomal protein L13
MKTYVANSNTAERTWHIVDAEGIAYLPES